MDLHLYTNLLTIKFADDSTFIGSGKSRDEVELLVNSELKKIYSWFVANKLTLHPNKSKFLIHSRDKLMLIKLNNVVLQRSGYGLQEESVKLLGVEIDENLDWKCQVRNVMKKISKGNYLLWRHKRKLSNVMKKTIYESFVRCHILYGLTVWGGAADSVVKPLEKLLSKIWSKIGNYKMHTLNRLSTHGIFKFKDELRIQESKFVWKWVNNKVPLGLKYIITEKQDNLRGRRFNITRTWKSGFVALRLAKQANYSIVNIAKAKSKSIMTKQLKKEIKNSYVFVCRQRNCFVCGNRRW